jgi:membrane protein DedA with SNARE-associated domain
VQFVTHVIDMGGYAGIVALMGLNSACIPLPSEIIMPFSGYLVYLGRFNLFLVATCGGGDGGLQSWLGDCLLDRRQGRAAAGGALRQMGSDEPPRSGPHDWFFDKYGSHHRVAGADAAGGATFIAFPAGIAKNAAAALSHLHFVGSWPWYFRLAYAGMKLGERWHTDPRFYQLAFHRFHLAIETRAAGGDRLVCMVACEARQASGGCMKWFASRES